MRVFFDVMRRLRASWGAAVCAAILPLAASAQRAATHSSNIWGVTFASDEASVATVARGEMRIWSLPSGQLACRLDGNYYSAAVAADGPSGYHVTFMEYNNGRKRALRAVRVNATTCAQTPAPVDSRVQIERSGDGYTIAVAGRQQLESADMPTAHEQGSTLYTCTTRETRGEFTYHRIEGDRRPEKVGSAKPDRYGAGACGDLTLSPDGAYLLDAAGTVVDLQRKRVVVSYSRSQPTSVGFDPEARVMVAGHGSGAVTVDAGSGKPTAQVGGSSMHGYVSPRATWIAIASSLIARPLVELQSRRFGRVVLDDARSRPAADILGAQREAETKARLERERREMEAIEAERARRLGVTQASAERFMQQIASQIGIANNYSVLRHRGSAGGYETMDIRLGVGDVLVLGSEEDGNVEYQVTDGTHLLRSIGRRERTSGRALTQTVITEAIEGTLNVFAGKAPVWVFVVRRSARR